MSVFDQRLARGKIGEDYIATWLRKVCHYHILPVYEKEISEGKGPVLYAATDTLIAPDLFAFRDIVHGKDNVKWIEAKTKTAFTWHRITREWLTGIDLRHYRDYLRVRRLSPFPIWLLFLHLDGIAKDTPSGMKSPTGLFGGDLLVLSQKEHHRHYNWGPSGMVYWSYSTLARLASLEQVLQVQAKKPEDDLVSFAVNNLGAVVTEAGERKSDTSY